MTEGQRHQPHPASAADEGAAPAALRHALQEIRAALTADPAASVSIATVAAVVGVSQSTLTRIFRTVLGRVPRAFVQHLRLEAARRTLAAGATGSVLEAALLHGFANPGRFAMAYARAFGERPSTTYRQLGASRGSASRQPAQYIGMIVLRPIEAAAPRDIANARRSTDELSAAICRRRDIGLSDVSTGLRTGRTMHYRLQGRLDGNAVTLELVHPLRGTLAWTGRQSFARRERWGWAERCIENVRAAIEAEQVEAARRVPRQQADSDTLFARARPAARTMDIGGFGIALDLLNDALNRDPAHARAHALAGWCLGQGVIHHFTRDAADQLRRMDMHAARARALAPDDPEVLTMLAAVKTFHRNGLDEAERLCLASLALDPDQPDAWRRLAWVHNYRGDWRRGLDAFRRSLQRWPDGYDGALSLIGVGVACFGLGDYARSARALTRVVEHQPSLRWVHRYLTPAAVHAGATGVARHSIETLRRGFPDLRIGDFEHLDIMRGEALVRMQEGHARAGMPH